MRSYLIRENCFGHSALNAIEVFIASKRTVLILTNLSSFVGLVYEMVKIKPVIIMYFFVVSCMFAFLDLLWAVLNTKE